MYFPILRGKQFEFLCIFNLMELIKNNKCIIPIIEPVKLDEKSRKYFKQLYDNNINNIIIVNPVVGDVSGEYARVKEFILEDLCKDGKKKFGVAFYLNNNTELDELDRLFKDFYGFEKYIIHQENFKDKIELTNLLNSKNEKFTNIVNSKNISILYIEEVIQSFNCGDIVLLVDGFKKKPRNKDYPEESMFSNVILNYKLNNFYGYSDYLTIGDVYNSKGYSPFCIAIHYTVINKGIYIKHFISDNNINNKDQKNKFLEASKKLYEYISKDMYNEYINTQGTREIMDYYTNGKYPGPGKVKQFSMEHHIEVISKLDY